MFGGGAEQQNDAPLASLLAYNYSQSDELVTQGQHAPGSQITRQRWKAAAEGCGLNMTIEYEG